MKTYLGIDYGRSKIGLAKGDDQARIATPFFIIQNKNNIESALADILDQEGINEIVIGYPISLSGNIGPQAREVDEFIGKLEKMGRPVSRQDERFSTRSAVSSGHDDASSAALILQTYLDSIG